jgi:hypothetical protein
MMVRNSERSSFNTCRHRWAWTWNNGVQAALAPYALRFGDLIHQALAAYYLPGRKRGEHPATTFAIIYHDQANELRDKGFDVYSDDKWVDALDLGVGMLNGYVEQYRDADDEYEVIASEQTFKVRVRVPATVINGEVIEPAFAFWMVGTFDGVWRNLRTGRLFFKEFKTAAAITDDGLNMDEQATLYYTYGPKWLQRHGLLGVGETISHILYTRLRKAIPDPEATYSPEGLVLNKPTKEALEEAWANLGNDSEGALPALPPRLDGKKGKPRGEDYAAALMAAGIDIAQLGEPSKVQPKPYFSRVPVYRGDSERQKLHERVLADAREIWRARSGSPLITVTKNPGPLHMPNCRGCAVRDACEVHEAGGDWKSVYDATTIKWEPYAAHELPERV